MPPSQQLLHALQREPGKDRPGARSSAPLCPARARRSVRRARGGRVRTFRRRPRGTSRRCCAPSCVARRRGRSPCARSRRPRRRRSRGVPSGTGLTRPCPRYSSAQTPRSCAAPRRAPPQRAAPPGLRGGTHGAGRACAGHAPRNLSHRAGAEAEKAVASASSVSTRVSEKHLMWSSCDSTVSLFGGLRVQLGPAAGRARPLEGIHHAARCLEEEAVGVELALGGEDGVPRPLVLRDATCPLSTRGGTRLVRLVREGGGGVAPRRSLSARALGAGRTERAWRGAHWTRGTSRGLRSAACEENHGVRHMEWSRRPGVYSRDMGSGNSREGEGGGGGRRPRPRPSWCASGAGGGAHPDRRHEDCLVHARGLCEAHVRRQQRVHALGQARGVCDLPGRVPVDHLRPKTPQRQPRGWATTSVCLYGPRAPQDPVGGGGCPISTG